MVSATLMLAVVVTAAEAGTMAMEVVTARELDGPEVTTLLEAVPADKVAATVVAKLKVSLQVQALELGQVLAVELDRPVALALMVQAMPPESVAAPVAALVLARMVGQAVVQVPDLDPVAEDSIKFHLN